MKRLLRGVAVWSVVLLMVIMRGGAQLTDDYYEFMCPNVEFIVRQAVEAKLSQTFVTVPATLRLFFHDCFVEGCDASVMISSPSGNAEKDAPDNLSLAGDGFDTVVQAKAAVEAACPGVVSCADILAIAARDVVLLSGGPTFDVELGRLDGLVSQSWRVAGNLPDPSFSVDLLSLVFARNNLSFTDMIALSGAHTVGFSHCDRVNDRLYSGGGAVDPSLNSVFAAQLMQACPRDADPNVAVNLDLTTPSLFDNAYYENLVQGEGLLSSDQALFSDQRSRPMVREFAGDPAKFAAAFAAAMVKLGRVGVKTGDDGEVRRDCSVFN